MKFDNGDQVVHNGLFVTVQVGDIKATRQYLDTWQVRRAVETLKKKPRGSGEFFQTAQGGEIVTALEIR